MDDYAAFISYSHTRDHRLAATLRANIERMGRGYFSARSLRVFHDQANVAMTMSLWDDLKVALDRASFLIVLLSPESARSPWVALEIDYFLSSRPLSRLGLVLTAGTSPWTDPGWDADAADSAAPAVLRARVGDRQPFVIDFRPFRSANGDLDTRPSTCRHRLASIVAALTGRDKDVVYGEHLAALRRRIAMFVGGCAVVVAGLTTAAWYAKQATESRRRARGEEHTRLVQGARALAAVPGSELEAVTAALRLAGGAPVTDDVYGALLDAVSAADRSLPFHAAEGDDVACLAISPRGDVAATLGHAGRASLWELGRTRPSKTFDAGGAWGHGGPLPDQCELSFVAGGASLLARVDERGAFLWNVEGGKELLRRSAVQVREVATGGDHVVITADGAPPELRDARTGNLGAALPDLPPLGGAKLSPDGTRLLLYDRYGTLPQGARTALFVDLPSGEILARIPGQKGAIDQADIAPNGKRFLTVSRSAEGMRPYEVQIWTERGQPFHLLGHHRDLVALAAFSPDGSRVVTAEVPPLISRDRPDASMPPRVFRADGTQLGELPGTASPILGFAFSPDSRQLVSVGHFDRDPVLWNLCSLEPLRRLSGHTQDVVDLAFVPDGVRVLTASSDGELRLAAPSGGPGARLFRFTPRDDGQATGIGLAAGLFTHTDGVCDRELGEDSDWVVTSAAGAMAITERQGVTIWNGGSPARVRTLTAGSTVWQPLALSADGASAAASVEKGAVVWNVASGAPRALPGAPEAIGDLRFSPDGRWLAGYQRDVRFGLVGHVEDHAVYVWDARNPAQKPHVLPHDGVVQAIAFARDGSTLATAVDRTVLLWDLGTGRRGAKLADSDAPVRDLHMHDDRLLAVSYQVDEIAGSARPVTLAGWNIRSGAVVWKLDDQTSFRRWIELSARGRWFVTPGEHRDLELRDAATGALVGRFAGHDDRVASARFLDDDRLLVSADAAGALRLWRVPSTSLIAQLAGRGQSVRALDVTDRADVVVATADGLVKILQVAPAALRTRACEILAANPPAECRP